MASEHTTLLGLLDTEDEGTMTLKYQKPSDMLAQHNRLESSATVL